MSIQFVVFNYKVPSHFEVSRIVRKSTPNLERPMIKSKPRVSHSNHKNPVCFFFFLFFCLLTRSCQLAFRNVRCISFKEDVKVLLSSR